MTVYFKYLRTGNAEYIKCIICSLQVILGILKLTLSGLVLLNQNGDIIQCDQSLRYECNYYCYNHGTHIVDIISYR
jgi:hypothetical protein